MRTRYTFPVAGLSGTTDVDHGLTFRQSMNQQIVNRGSRPIYKRTPAQDIARDCFAAVKFGYSTITAAHIAGWAALASAYVGDPNRPTISKIPWAAYHMVNSARWHAGEALIAVAPSLAPTWSIIDVYQIRRHDAPLSTIWFYFTAVGLDQSADWFKLRLSHPLPSAQRHASDSQMTLVRDSRVVSSIVHPQADFYAYWLLNSGPWKAGDWVDAIGTPYNADFIPGTPIFYHGQVRSP